MQSRPPMDYKKAMVLAEEVTRSYNGKQDRLWNKTDLYSSYRQAQSGKAESGRLEAENRKLKTEISNLTKSMKGINPKRGGGHSDKYSTRTPPRRLRKSGQGQESVDVFHEDRKDVSAALLD